MRHFGKNELQQLEDGAQRPSVHSDSPRCLQTGLSSRATICETLCQAPPIDGCVRAVCILLESDPAWISFPKALDEDKPLLFRVSCCLSAEIGSFCAQHLSPLRVCRGCFVAEHTQIAEPTGKPTALGGGGQRQGAVPSGRMGLPVGLRWRAGARGGGSAPLKCQDETERRGFTSKCNPRGVTPLPSVNACCVGAKFRSLVTNKGSGLGISDQQPPAL